MTDSSSRNHDFPVGSQLVSALIDLHCETENDNLLDLIESEILTEVLGLVAVGVPDETPAPDAAVETLIDLHDQNHLGKDVNRYIRLRIFDALGAFEKCRVGGDADSVDVIAELSDNDLLYLDSLDDAEIQLLIADELTHRDMLEANE